MNFIQKGLAGLESRLDKVLLDEPDQCLSANTNTPTSSYQPSEPIPPRHSVESVGRDGRISMQERLAAAVAKKNSGNKTRSPMSKGLEVLPTIHTDVSTIDIDGPREKETVDDILNKESSYNVNQGRIKARAGTNEKFIIKKDEQKPIQELYAETHEPMDLPKHPADIPSEQPVPQMSKQPGTHLHRDSLSTDTSASVLAGEFEETIIRLQSDLLVCETRRQEESDAASERINALEEKLRYLARESVAASRDRAVACPTEKQLAERDEKIAILIEEGEKLSQTELKLQNTVKKFRAKVVEEEKAKAEAKRLAQKLEREITDHKEKLANLRDIEKRFNDNLKNISRFEQEISALKRENDNYSDLIDDLKEKSNVQTRILAEVKARAETEASEREIKIITEMRAQFQRIQNEGKKVEEKLKAEVEEIKSKSEREAEKSSIREKELKFEQSVLESKMEALRNNAEEASSSADVDAQAKLLRQVETLQMQYSIASENWQGIEGALMSRVTSLENEREELSKREVALRIKARETNLTSQKLELNLESALCRIKDLEIENSLQKNLNESLRKRVLDTEATYEKLNSSHRDECEKLEQEFKVRIEEERHKWEESSRMVLISRPGSPLITQNASPLRKTSTAFSATESYFLGYPNQRQRPPSRSPSADPLNSTSPYDRKTSHGEFKTPPVSQYPRISGLPSHNFYPTSFGVGLDESEDYFDNFTSFPHPHPDVLSVSAIGAGPSVQLVERMSATIRRLESEIDGSHEETSRMATQRDEARHELVELMQEIEEKRKAEEKSRKLETEVREVNVKLETSLEMLGEKSELVEELRADVADLKQMYRDLVSATLK